MKSARKAQSLFESLQEGKAMLRDMLVEQPQAWLAEAREKIRDLPKTNFDLGCQFAERGQWYDAMFRFHITLYLQPNYPQARYNLGCCYYRLGKLDRAREVLKQVIRETPNHAEAVFTLASIDPSAIPPAQRPQTMPLSIVTEFFTSIAQDYDAVEKETQYRGPALVAAEITPLLPPTLRRVVDLGCGTGLAATAYRASAAEIIGVDITPAMVEQARAARAGDKLLYDQLFTANIAALGETITPALADLVLLVNVVQFVGALPPVLAQAAALLAPGGFLVMTVEPFSGEGFGVAGDTGRFGHSVSYATQAGAGAGLSCLKQTRIALYPETRAELLIFHKPQQGSN